MQYSHVEGTPDETPGEERISPEHWGIPGLKATAISFDGESVVDITEPAYNEDPPYPYVDSYSMGYHWDADRQQLTLTDRNGIAHTYPCRILNLSKKGFPWLVLAIEDEAEATAKALKDNPGVTKVVLTAYLASKEYQWDK